MLNQRLVCPHPGCDAENAAPASFCARCGRPLTLEDQHTATGGGLLWLIFPLLAFFALAFLAMSGSWRHGWFIWFVPAFLFACGAGRRRRACGRGVRIRRRWRGGGY